MMRASYGVGMVSPLKIVCSPWQGWQALPFRIYFAGWAATLHPGRAAARTCLFLVRGFAQFVHYATDADESATVAFGYDFVPLFFCSFVPSRPLARTNRPPWHLDTI